MEFPCYPGCLEPICTIIAIRMLIIYCLFIGALSAGLYPRKLLSKPVKQDTGIGHTSPSSGPQKDSTTVDKTTMERAMHEGANTKAKKKETEILAASVNFFYEEKKFSCYDHVASSKGFQKDSSSPKTSKSANSEFQGQWTGKRDAGIGKVFSSEPQNKSTSMHAKNRMRTTVNEGADTKAKTKDTGMLAASVNFFYEEKKFSCYDHVASSKGSQKGSTSVHDEKNATPKTSKTANTKFQGQWTVRRDGGIGRISPSGLQNKSTSMISTNSMKPAKIDKSDAEAKMKETEIVTASVNKIYEVDRYSGCNHVSASKVVQKESTSRHIEETALTETCRTAKPEPQKNSIIMEKPEILIRTLQNGRLEVSTTCIEKLERLEGQLVVVSIVGLYRTGKSYLLNRLAGKSTGFALGATIESKTKGIWIWVCPHPVLKDTHLVLLDTEGLGDARKGDLRHDNSIFTLATLLSSTLIYNIIGCVNEDVISKLDFITGISKMIKVRKGDDINDAEFDIIFPQFVMAVRDFSLVLELGGEAVTANEYLESLLALDPNKSDSEEFNRPRVTIRKYFKNRVCFTFDRPGSRKILRNLEKFCDEDLSEDFIADTKTFLDYAFDGFAPMKLRNGYPINGKHFVLLSATYIKAMNDREVPCIETAFNQVVEQGNKDAMDKAIQEYDGYMETLILPLNNEEELSGHHRKAMDVALKILKDAVVDDVDECLQREFSDKIRSALQAVTENDEKKSTEQCQKTLEKHGRAIMQNLLMKEYLEAGGYTKYKHDVGVLKKEYYEHAKGVSVEDVWSKYLVDHVSEVDEIRDMDEQLTDAQRRKEAADYLAENEERNRTRVEAALEKNRRDLEDMENDFRETEKTLHDAYEKKLDDIKAREEEMYKKRKEEENRLLEEGFKKLAEEEQKTRQRLEREARERELAMQQRLEREAKLRESELQQRIAVLEGEIQRKKGKNVIKRVWKAVKNK